MTRYRISVKPIVVGGVPEWRVKGEVLIGRPQTYLIAPYRIYVGNEVFEEGTLSILLPRKPKTKSELEQYIKNILQALNKDQSGTVRFELGTPQVVTVREVPQFITDRTMVYEEGIDEQGRKVIRVFEPLENVSIVKKRNLPVTFRVHLRSPEALVVFLSRVLMNLGNLSTEWKGRELVIHGVGGKNYLNWFMSINKKGEEIEEKVRQGLLKIPPAILQTEDRVRALLELKKLGIPVEDIFRNYVLT